MLGLRFLGGAALNLAISLLWERHHTWSWKEVANAALVGIFLLIGGTGMVGYAEKTVSSHVAAVVIASMPLWIALWEAAWKKRWVLTARQGWGTVLGLVGVAVLMGKGEGGGAGWQMDRVGMGLLAAAMLCWSFGSAYSHMKPMPAAPLMSAAIQMAVGGIVFLAWGWGTGEVSWAGVEQASARSWWAVAYLAVFGSTIAFTAFAWLMRVEPPTRVASYSLVNPVVAIAIGAWLGHERVMGATWIGLGLVLAGLWLHMSGKKSDGTR